MSRPGRTLLGPRPARVIPAGVPPVSRSFFRMLRGGRPVRLLPGGGRRLRLGALFAVIPAFAAIASERGYAPEAVPRVAAFPKLIGVGSAGAVEVQVEMPPRSGKPALSTFDGTTVEAKLEDGVWYGRYKPPMTSKGPGYDLILAQSGAGAVGVATIELHAPVKVQVDGQPPKTPVMVRIGGREFGPFATDDKGEALLSIDMPPAVDEVEIVAPGKEPVKEKLAVPPLRRMFLQAPRASTLGKNVVVTAVAIDRKGGVLTGKPSVTATRAAVRSVSDVGPGVWKITLAPEGGPITLTVKTGSARARHTIAVPWPKKTPVPAPTLEPVRVPNLLVDAPPLPSAPTCEELEIAPGAVVTAARLRKRIDEASRESDLIARRDRLIALECVFPEEHAVRLQLTAAWLLLGDNQTALATIEGLLTDEEEIHDEHIALGLSYRAAAELRLGRLDAAAQSARKALEIFPGLYSASYTLGSALFLQKDFNGAQAALMSAYRSAPGFASEIDHAMLAEILDAKRQPQEALPHRIALARFEPNDIDRWREAARTAEAAGRWERAHEAWLMIAASTLPGFDANGEALSGAARAAVAAAKDPEITWLEAALAAERAGNPARALFLFDKAVATNGENVVARYHYARILSQSGNHAVASQQIGSVLNATPRWVPALVLGGDIDRAKGENERALARYREAAATSPTVPMSTVARWRLSEMQK